MGRPMWWQAPRGATWSHGIDLVAVRRAVAMRGACPELTDEERRYAVVEAARAGVPGPVFAVRIGITPRTETRWRLEAETEQQGVTACA